MAETSGRLRRSWPALAVAAALAAGLPACASSSPGHPAALSVRCAGHALAAPDTDEIGLNNAALAKPATAVRGVPRPRGTVASARLPDVLDPADPRYGYSASGWQVARVSGSGGRALWSAAIRLPGHTRSGLARPDVELLPHTGYVIATGGAQGQDIAAVGSGGQSGPACVLPLFAATDRPVDLLPHEGVVVLANPTQSREPTGGKQDYWLDGYSTAAGRRLWSVDTGTSVAEESVTFQVSGGTAYVWQEQDGQVAAYNARTGQRRWLADSGTVAPLTSDNGLLGVIDGRVFALADEGTSERLVVLDGATGKLAWKRDIALETGTSQVTVSQVGAGLVLLSGASNLEDDLLSVSTGATVSSLVVTADAGEPQLCAPGGHLAVVVDENDAIGVLSTDPADNRTIALPAAGSVSVAVTGTLAYARAESAGAPVYGYDLATGKLKWKVRAPGTSAQSGLDAFNGGFAVLDRSGGVVYH